MANATGQTPQGTADLTTHIHNTFVNAVLQANQTSRVWAFLHEGTPFQHKSGSNVSVPIEGELAVSTAVLPEKDDPAPLTSSDSAAVLPCNDYGAYVMITRKAVEDKDMATITAKSIALGNHAVKTADLIAGTAAMGGANVRFANGRADATFLLNTDEMNLAEFVYARALLRRNGAPKYANGLYKAVLSTDQVGSMFSDGATAAGLIQQIRYAKPEALISAEIGSFHGFTVLESGQLGIIDKDDPAGGAGTAGTEADRQRAIFCGRGYLGYTERRATQFKGFGPAGDVMEKLFKMLWDGRWGWGIVNELNGVRIETRAAVAVNP